MLKDAGFETFFDTWIEGCRKRMTERLDHVDAALKHDRLSSVRIERGCLRITPHDAATPAAALRLDRAIDAVMPRIRIAGLLWEVNARTGFLDAFVDLRSGGKHPEPAAMLAAILAGAVNLGLERMAYASTRLTHAQLIWAQTWHLRSETCSDALARIIDARHDLPFAQNRGEDGRTSSDGQFLSACRGGGMINARHGPDPGLKTCSFLSGRHGSFHSSADRRNGGRGALRS